MACEVWLRVEHKFEQSWRKVRIGDANVAARPVPFLLAAKDVGSEPMTAFQGCARIANVAARLH